jgi:uncharacterized membrane protein YgdD (TMEM256/DUF423 family)
MASPWHRAAALAGASAVAAGAWGAHGHRPEAPAYAAVYETANKYHFYHAGLLAVAPLARRPALVGGLAAAGVALFSGSCYAVALAEDRALGRLAPVGGACLIAAWLALAL